MYPTAVADHDAVAHRRDELAGSTHRPAVAAGANHLPPARTSTEEDRDHSDDAATIAASEELKHTTISDRANVPVHKETAGEEAEPSVGDEDMQERAKACTPDQDDLRERLSSPKKKRGRDLEDDTHGSAGSDGELSGSAVEGGGVNPGRTARSEPEKKRPRDTSEDTTGIATKVTKSDDITALSDTTRATPTDLEGSKSPLASTKPIFGSALNGKPQTSTSAFQNSGFGALAGSGTSGFGTIGASKPSVFGGGAKATTSGFGALGGAISSAISPTTTAEGGASTVKPATGFGFGSGASTSGFGALGSSSVFGSALKNGFSGRSGPKLSSFAAPSKDDAPPTKPAKAFGAPDSDEDEGSDVEDSDGASDTAEDEGVKTTLEDKKKSKISRAPVEDGESGEATMLQLRAKLFALDSKESGWKERGVGTLKINVPESCASFDENAVAVPGSFDASGLEDDDAEETSAPRVPRLVMRQENTHRVILNTIIVRAMQFIDKPSATSAQILFTAFEGEKDPKPVNMLLKMSEGNSKLFRNEIESIQHEL